MLGLTLRAEFLSSQMPGTQINLSDYVDAHAADKILAITYPTADVRNALQAAAGSEGRPVVIIGQRGSGKSHLMAVLHYAFLQPLEVSSWAAGWATELEDPAFAQLSLPSGFTPVSVVMSDQEYNTLWDPIFTALHRGAYYQGRLEQAKTPLPSRALLEEALAGQPLALILDELQTWYDTQRSGEGGPRELAFNFLQILSELASDRPDLLRLIVSVRDSESEAYRQVHRNNPVLVDFKRMSARRDRVHLTQHRLFENYRQIPPSHVATAVAPYAEERLRLLHPAAPGPRADELRAEVRDYWPFAPELMRALEDEILMAAAAQDTRDLMRILVRMYRTRGDAAPLLTVADIWLTNEQGGSADLASMVDVLTGGGQRLRQVALRNVQSVLDGGLALPHAVELLSALWVRSLAAGRQAGATAQQLHLDITRDQPIDDNAFDNELEQLKTASFNVHDEGDRLIFKAEENPRARLLASARNDNTFDHRQDLAYLQTTLAHALNPIDAATIVVSLLFVLGPDWETEPWTGRETDELPNRWSTPVVLVIPEYAAPERLARWLIAHVPARRNLVRFLMPTAGRTNAYRDEELRHLARCACLADAWGKTDPQYRKLLDEFQKPLREKLLARFDRLALLAQWDYQHPGNTRFDGGALPGDGPSVRRRIEDYANTSVFDPGSFADYVTAAAAGQPSAAAIIDGLMDAPATPDAIAIPFLGRNELYERMLTLVARGEIAVNVSGAWYRREPADADTGAALRRISMRAYARDRELQHVVVALPTAVPAQPQIPPPPAVQPTAQVGNTAGLFGLTTSDTGATTSPGGITYSGGPAGGRNTVNDGHGSAPPAPAVTTRRSNGARTKGNLLGEYVNWGLAGKQISAVRIAGPLTADQLKAIINALPATQNPAFTLEVDVAEPGS